MNSYSFRAPRICQTQSLNKSTVHCSHVAIQPIIHQNEVLQIKNSETSMSSQTDKIKILKLAK